MHDRTSITRFRLIDNSGHGDTDYLSFDKIPKVEVKYSKFENNSNIHQLSQKQVVLNTANEHTCLYYA